MMVTPTVPLPNPGGSLSIGPSDVPPIQPGRYYVGVYNPNTVAQTFSLFATILPPSPSATTVNFASAGPVPLLDDAVTVSSNSIISITNTEPIVSVNVGIVVQHPRISDLAFTLVSPNGQRILLMENRGGDTTNGAGATILTTNSIANFTTAGTTNASTNFVFVSQPSGTLPISWNFFQIPDQMTVYDTTNNFTAANLIFDTGMVSGSGQTNLPYTTASGALTIIMNQFGNPNGAGGDAWTYTAGGVATNYVYLTFTEDTNLTTTPIKFAVPPFTNSPVLVSLPPQLFYTNDFENPTIGSEWSNTNTDVTPIGFRRFLGQFGPGSVTLSLSNLPVHTNITLGFDFFQIRSWDGNYNLNPVVDPDFWTLQLTGSPTPLLYTTFICAADTGYYQSYPSNYPASFPAYTGASEVDTLGYYDPNSTTKDDGVYHMHFSSVHTGNSLQVQFIGGETQAVTDESWGLDNVFVGISGGSYLTNTGLYYLPEQSLASLDGGNAQGNWTLEIQDDRAGAYDPNNPPALVSWELQFVFADTNAVPAVLSGGIGQSNQFIPAGDIAWYQINVPTIANYATNILKFASAPVNVWFSTNVPPTITNTPNDQILIPNATFMSGTNGSDVLNTTNSSPLLVAGSTYYLGVQNPNSSTVNYGIEVDFDHGNSTNSTLPQLVVSKVVQTGGGKIQFQWTASSSAPVEVQWTTNLASQVWNTITNPATTTVNGVSTFTDDGSQTAPLGAVRFYRLVQVN